jgi:uncharacterized small protein (DUF1192 family)
MSPSAAAEAKARAKGDSLVEDKVGPVKQRVAALQAEVTERVAGQEKGLDEVDRQLQEELKRLSGGIIPDIKLPEIKL